MTSSESCSTPVTIIAGEISLQCDIAEICAQPPPSGCSAVGWQSLFVAQRAWNSLHSWKLVSHSWDVGYVGLTNTSLKKDLVFPAPQKRRICCQQPVKTYHLCSLQERHWAERSTEVTGWCHDNGIPLLQISTWLGFVELPAQCERFGSCSSRAKPPLLIYMVKPGVQGRCWSPLQVPRISI